MNRILIHGGILSLIGGLLILGSLKVNPRLWLQDFPDDIQQAVAPRTRWEKKLAALWGVPYLLVSLAVPTISCYLMRRTDPSVSYGALYVNAFGIATLFNLFDLLVIDWLVICAITPDFVVVPGTRGAAGYNNYGHHLRGFFVGMMASVVICAGIAGLVKLVG